MEKSRDEENIEKVEECRFYRSKLMMNENFGDLLN